MSLDRHILQFVVNCMLKNGSADNLVRCEVGPADALGGFEKGYRDEFDHGDIAVERTRRVETISSVSNLG